MELKIFQIIWHDGESDWIAAYTNMDALQVYCGETSTDITDWDEKDEIVEVPRSLWPEKVVINTEYDPDDPEDIKSQTFEDYMKKATKSGLIATTIY